MIDEPTQLARAMPVNEGYLEPGHVLFNTYVVDRHVSSGGMGEVYAAHSRVDGTPYAIKVIKLSRVEDERVRDLFIREGKVLQRIRSPAVVSYAGQLQDEQGRCYLIMEYVDGPSLADRLRRRPLDAEQGQDLLLHLANAFVEVHAAGAYHRDLSPDNILLPNDDPRRAVVIDFGIAKLRDLGHHTLVGSDIAGKLGYMAPEQLGLYDDLVDARIDIYALALVIAAAVRGQPIDMGNDLASATRARRQVPELDGVPEALRPVLTHMLAPDPVDRLPSMEAVIAVATGARGATAPVEPASLRSKVPLRRRRRDRWTVQLSLWALTAVGGTAAWLLLTEPNPNQRAEPSDAALAEPRDQGRYAGAPAMTAPPDTEPEPPSGAAGSNDVGAAVPPPSPAALDANTVRAALPPLPCATVFVAVAEAGIVTLGGAVARASDGDALVAAATAVPGVSEVQHYGLQVLPDTVCLASALVGELPDDQTVAVFLNRDDGRYVEDDIFVVNVDLVEIDGRHLYVDLFPPPADDGERLVYHLLPRADAPTTVPEVTGRVQIGSFPFQSEPTGPIWALGAPFGDAVVTVILSPVELPRVAGDDGMSGSALAYLESLRTALGDGATGEVVPITIEPQGEPVAEPGPE